MISPALPEPEVGTAGTTPASRNRVSSKSNSEDTPASPVRKFRSRTANSARTSSAGSHGGPPTARASSRLFWCCDCSTSVSPTLLCAPIPVVTP